MGTHLIKNRPARRDHRGAGGRKNDTNKGLTAKPRVTKGPRETVRAFVAIKLPDELIVRLKEVRDTFAFSQKDISWVRPGSIHLTLKFLGDIATDEVDTVAAALTLASAGIRPFTLKARSLGAFPSERSPRVLWAGIEDHDELRTLHQNIEDRLFDSGFDKDGRPFHPHLTLARIKNPSAGRQLAKKLETTRPDIDVDFRVDYFVLFKSVLTQKGAEHTELKRFELG